MSVPKITSTPVVLKDVGLLLPSRVHSDTELQQTDPQHNLNQAKIDPQVLRPEASSSLLLQHLESTNFTLDVVLI
jgi:hypothetical protein